MPLVRWSGGWPQWNMFDDALDRFVRDVDSFRGTGNRAEGWIPSVNIAEKEDGYVITAEIPGLSKDDVNIEVKENTLTISGEKKDITEEKDTKYHRVECQYGKFERSFFLPTNVDAESIKANFKNGQLEISVSKKAEAQARKIQIAEAN